MTFDEWLNEVEVYSTRQERLESDVDLKAIEMGELSYTVARERMYEWLEAAYSVGREAGYDAGADAWGYNPI